MMHRPRWRKIVRDLFQHKGRTILTIASIAVGVLAVGFTDLAQNVLGRGLATVYQASSPSQATFLTTPFTRNLARQMNSIPGVAMEQSRTLVNALINTATVNGKPNQDTWQSLQVMALPDFAKQAMDKVTIKQGHVPNTSGMMLDVTTMAYLHVHVGSSIWVQDSSGEVRRVRITGEVQDTEQISSPFSGTSYGYIRTGELTQFGTMPEFNTVSIQVQGNRLDQSHIEAVATNVRKTLRADGIQVTSTMIPEPGKHWAYDILHSITSVLHMIGYLDIVLSVCLVFNTVMAVLTTQVRQMGVMKTIGASSGQLIRLYLGYVACLSFIAVVIGVPLAILVSQLVAANSVTLLGLVTNGLGFSPQVALEMLGVGVLLPLLTVLYPIVSQAKLPIRIAISGQCTASFSRFDEWLGKIKGLPRGAALALRNTFRHKWRLVLTVSTLGLGGAVVMGTLTVQASLTQTIHASLQYSDYNFRVTLATPAQTNRLQTLAASVPGVQSVQSFGQAVATIVRSSGDESMDLNLLAPPSNSTYVHPQIVEGRWLNGRDGDAIVMDTYVLKENPEVQLGDTLTLDISGRRATFHVVGFLKKVAGEVDMYTTPVALEDVTAERGVTSLLNVRTTTSSVAGVAQIAGRLRATLTSRGYRVAGIETTNDIQTTDESRFRVVMTLMETMGVLITMVSALGLMGTQSLNVLERTREIGVLRSIGASTGAIWALVVEEGLVVGLFGWLVAVLLSVPVSHLLSDSVGESLFSNTLDYHYALWGIPVWFGVALVSSVVSSLGPANHATRLTIRDVLSHDG